MRLRWNLAWLLGLALTSTSPARAGLHPRIVDEPRGIALVGHDGTPDPAGAVVFTVVDRFTGVPLSNVPVQISFANCADVRLASNVVAADVILDCGFRAATVFTNASGQARFVVVGEVSGAGDSGGPCASVNVVGYLFDPLVVSAFDLDGVQGVNGLDLSHLAGDLFSGRYHSLTDYDGDGDNDAIDLGRFARVLIGGGSVQSGVACP